MIHPSLRPNVFVVSGDRARASALAAALPIAPEHFAIIRDAMYGVVNGGGTGGAARMQVPGVGLAAKTGTAQVVVGNRYSSEVYNSTFAGFFPADAPRVTVTVMVHNARVNHHGSQLAAPIYREIAANLLSAWGVTPQLPTSKNE